MRVLRTLQTVAYVLLAIVMTFVALLYSLIAVPSSWLWRRMKWAANQLAEHFAGPLLLSAFPIVAAIVFFGAAYGYVHVFERLDHTRAVLDMHADARDAVVQWQLDDLRARVDALSAKLEGK